MPYKNQSACYRTIKGIRYLNWCDVLGEEERLLAAGLKKRGLPHRLVSHKDGFKILFVAESIPMAIADDILDQARTHEESGEK